MRKDISSDSNDYLLTRNERGKCEATLSMFNSTIILKLSIILGCLIIVKFIIYWIIINLN